jgi:hypothetical protein
MRWFDWVMLSVMLTLGVGLICWAFSKAAMLAG